jgi:hypothetical protein
MKRIIGRKPKIADKPAPTRYRSSGRLLWTVILVWVVLFLMIRAAFRFPANPALTFLIMFALLFVALLVVRYGVLRVQVWWQKSLRFLARIITKLFNKN